MRGWTGTRGALLLATPGRETHSVLPLLHRLLLLREDDQRPAIFEGDGASLRLVTAAAGGRADASSIEGRDGMLDVPIDRCLCTYRRLGQSPCWADAQASLQHPPCLVAPRYRHEFRVNLGISSSNTRGSLVPLIGILVFCLIGAVVTWAVRDWPELRVWWWRRKQPWITFPDLRIRSIVGLHEYRAQEVEHSLIFELHADPNDSSRPPIHQGDIVVVTGKYRSPMRGGVRCHWPLSDSPAGFRLPPSFPRRWLEVAVMARTRSSSAQESLSGFQNGSGEGLGNEFLIGQRVGPNDAVQCVQEDVPIVAVVESPFEFREVAIKRNSTSWRGSLRSP